MRISKGLAAGLVAIGLVGCSSSASQPTIVGPSATARGTGGAPPGTAPAAVPVSPKVRTAAGQAAAHFYGLYSASRFTTSWNLLSPATKRQVSRSVWVSVHDGCPSTSAGRSRIIKAVTVFGNAAIVTGAVSGFGTAEDVFNYANGRWSYSPGDLSIYHHGSVAADIAAAKAAGFCPGWKIF